MSDPKDPVKQLTDTLTLLRVEIADVKNRQISEKQLKHLQAALEDTSLKVDAVAECAQRGAERGAERLSDQMTQVSGNIANTIQRATQSISDAQTAIEDSFLSHKRNIYVLLLFSFLLGAVLSAWGISSLPGR